MRGKLISALAFLSLLIPASATRADEIRLKDGTKITGTIVGFENDSFRVETSYGFALIRKDEVADINITAQKKKPEPKVKSPTPGESSAPATPAAVNGNAPAVVPADGKEPSSTGSPSPEANAPAIASSATAAAKPDPAASKVKTEITPQPAPPPAPPPAPEPPVIRDEIRGNQYVNLTYGFQMFKPPSWELIPAARKALPDAVAALGTNDQTTLLVIGRERAKDSLDAHATATAKALADVYENYRQISTRHLNVAGFPAVEQRARGTADGRDWSVILLTLFNGKDAYTLLGMTWADSDLIQVQENVIEKTVNSLAFVAP
ncbi:MAG TPA: hypothetical protein VGI34_06740 [Candidatus Acidoferrales bacterium]